MGARGPKLIYYLIGDSLTAYARPFLEVLLLAHTIDEYACHQPVEGA